MRSSFLRQILVRMSWPPLVLFVLLNSVAAAQFKRIVVQSGEQAGEIERNVTTLLAERISEPSGLPVRVSGQGEATASSNSELLIMLGIPETHSGIRKEFSKHR